MPLRRTRVDCVLPLDLGRVRVGVGVGARVKIGVRVGARVRVRVRVGAKVGIMARARAGFVMLLNRLTQVAAVLAQALLGRVLGMCVELACSGRGQVSRLRRWRVGRTRWAIHMD